MAIKRALTLQNIADAKIAVYDFSGEWREAFGQPQRTGIWYVYGDSGHGKTSFILLLMRELARFGRILLVSYEEGTVSLALQKGIARFGMLDAEVKRQVKVVDDDLDTLAERLALRKSPDIVIIDSLDVSEFRSDKHVLAFTRKFPGKHFIFIGQARGKRPKKKIGNDVLFLANQKIYVEGFRAFSRGRSNGEKGYFDIWQKNAEEYWGENS